MLTQRLLSVAMGLATSACSTMHCHAGSLSDVEAIKGAVSSAAAAEERISNVCVTTDGEVASAVFDYAYVSAGQATNRGSEHWQLVRTEGGWKTYSVIYSIRNP